MRVNKHIIPIVIGLTLAACSEKDMVMQPQAESQAIALSASIDKGSQSGTRVADGTVETGTYYLSFINPGNVLQTVETEFADGTGYPWIYNPTASGGDTDENNHPLNWEDVTTEEKPVTFYLDNVQATTQEDNKTVTLGEAYNGTVYDADDTEANNDIVWGKLDNVAYNTTPLSFTLTHRMASVRVEIRDESEATTDETLYTVSLSGVKNTPATFDRTTGTITAANTPSDITLLNNGKLTEAENFTPTWILPPQTFGDNRPKLKIELNDGTTYSGTLPESMFSDAELTSAPQTLQFQASRLLTIRVTLVGEVGNREILFLPAVVEKWNPITLGQVIGRQLGIYDKADWKEVVDAYNSDPSANNATLQRFGTYNDNKWTIHIFSHIGEESESNFPKFNNDTNIQLEFHNWNVYGKRNIKDLTKSTSDTEENNPTTGDNDDDEEGSQEETLEGGETQTPTEG